MRQNEILYVSCVLVNAKLSVLVLVFLTSERDAFDTLFDHAPDKLNVVKRVCMLLLHL